jgi:tRNA-2-methylthio-N6-dimethylallyladenosine synthase
VVAERFDRLKVVVERSALERHRARVGRVEEALVEGPSKRDPDVMTGRTRQAKLVHFAGESGQAGTYVKLAVTGAAPHHLVGELVEPAVTRRRIPLRVRAG